MGRSTLPKKNFTRLGMRKEPFGKEVRIDYQNTILDKAPIFPKTLEYSDIDNAFFAFVENEIDLTVDGKLVPTYTLYSNQRFSEYTQMWEHSDENGNLYLNFKTVNREKNPSVGENQGKMWNIAGNRRYKIFQRDVLEDNGNESVEIYSMSQPYCIDLTYTVSFVTTTIESLNKFNQKLNKLFKSRQHYIRPNGHFIPMVLNDISDETAYSISDRKFCVQSASIKVMAYIIEKDDFEVKKYPKKARLFTNGEELKEAKKACVEIEEYDNPMTNRTIKVNITFKPWCYKTEFEFDTEMIVENVILNNIRTLRLMINDELYYTSKGFKLHEGDNVRIQTKIIEADKESSIHFVGYSPNKSYDSTEIPEKVSDEPIKHEEIDIESK